MSAPIRLSTPRLRVVLGNPDDPETWQELQVQSIRADMLGAEVDGAKLKVDAGTHGIRMSGFIAYHALRRTGQIQGTLADFEAGAIEVMPIDDEQVDPTQSEPITD